MTESWRGGRKGNDFRNGETRQEEGCMREKKTPENDGGCEDGRQLGNVGWREWKGNNIWEKRGKERQSGKEEGKKKKVIAIHD